MALTSDKLEQGTDADSKAYGSINGDAAVAAGADDAGVIPKGALDPVYEAKARVLNRAVRQKIKMNKKTHLHGFR